MLLAGALTVEAGGETVVLGPMDSCCIPGNQVRAVRNHGNEVATMLVVMPYPENKR